MVERTGLMVSMLVAMTVETMAGTSVGKMTDRMAAMKE